MRRALRAGWPKFFGMTLALVLCVCIDPSCLPIAGGMGIGFLMGYIDGFDDFRRRR